MKSITSLYRNAYTGLSPAMWWLSLVMLINRSGTMVVPFMTLYLTTALGCTIAKAALVMAIFGIGAVCGGILGGKLTDRFGFYNVQLVALLCGGAMFLVLGQLHSYEAICLCTFVLAALNESFRPANATAVAHYSNESNRTRCYSLNRLSVNLGWAFGGALGGFIASYNYSLLFWIDGFTNIGAAILLLIVLAPQRNSATPPRKSVERNTSNNTAWKDTPYLVFTGVTVLFGICFFQLFATQPVFFKEIFKLQPYQIGYTMAMNGILIAIIEMPLVYTLERKNNYMRFIVAGVLLCSCSFMILNLFPGGMALAVTATLIVTAGEMISMPFMNTFWTSRTNNSNRGQYAGLYTAAWSVAQVIGPYTGGQVAQHWGYTTLWWCIGFTGLLCAAGFNWLRLNTARYPVPKA